MPRIPHPDDMPRAALDPATNPAQLNVGVASRIGQAGRAMGNAVEALGGAFGEVIGRIGTANDGVAEGNARLETLKQLDAADLDMAANAGEDGAAWQTAPDRYKQAHEAVDGQYQISDPRRRAQFNLWREEQTYRRGRAAALNYQRAQHGLFTKGFDSDVAGLEERIAKGEVDPAAFGEYYGALDGKLNGMDRTVLSQADIEQKRRELQARLTMSLDRYLSTKAPGERAAFWDSVSKGQYEVDAAKPNVGGGSVTPFRGPISIDSTPSPNERAEIFRKGGVVVNLDSNWAKDNRQTSPMVVIPDNATPAQRQAAEAYASRIAEVYKQQFGKSLPPRVVTRSENGRGRPFTIHTEPFSVNDERAAEFFSSPAGAQVHAQILQETFGKVPGVHFSLPHDPFRKGDHGAKGPKGSEVDLARTVLQIMRDGAGEPKLVQEPREVSRGQLRVAAASQQADPTVRSDAIQPPPGIQVGPSTANDNAEQSGVDVLAGLGADADKIAAAASDNPDIPVTKVIDAARVRELAERYEAFRSVEDADSLTVGEFAELAKVAQQEAGDVAARDARTPQGAVGRDAPVRVAQAGDGTIPRGRLAPGQEFTVRTPKGEFKVPAEWINAIPDKLRAEYAKRAREDNRIYERQLRTTADEMMKSQEAHVAEHGRDAPDYDVRAVQAAYRSDPSKIASHARRIREAKALHEAFRTAPDMPDDEIVKRLEELRPKPGTPRANEVKDIFDKAEERVASLLKQREQDPGAAVESARPVQMVRERLVGGQPRNKLDQVALIDARLKAQSQLEIGEEARRPLPEIEARALAAPLRGAEPGVFAERIEALHKGIREKYGERYSGLIVRQVLGTFTRDKEKAKALEGALLELDESGQVSPTTMARIREREALGNQEKQLPPQPTPAPTVMERLNNFGRRIGATLPDFGLSNPFSSNASQPESSSPKTPPKAAVDLLRKNPALAVEFEKKYGLQAGEATRYLAR